MHSGNSTVVILAAGSSLRMGNHKFALELRPGLSFLEHICLQYNEFGCEQIIIVLSPDGLDYLNRIELNLPVGTQIVVNPVADIGRFSSVKAGLMHAKKGNLVFIHNVDNPFADKQILIKLFENHKTGAYTCPVFSGKGGHPVLLSSQVVNAILAEESNSLVLKDFLKGFERISVQVREPKVLVNINTVKDFKQLTQSGFD